MLDSNDVKYWELIHSQDKLGKKSQNTYVAVCDICGETNLNKKKLYLYKTGDMQKANVKCFVCDYSSSLYKYIKEIHPDLLSSFKYDTSSVHLGSLVKLAEEQKVQQANAQQIDEVQTQQISKIQENTNASNKPTYDSNLVVYNLNDYIPTLAKDNKAAQEYLINRGIQVEDSWRFGTSNIELEEKTYYLQNTIVIPLLDPNGMWYGFYSRNIYEKRFMTFIPQKNTNMKIWNWYNIDLSQPVFIFESIFDAISSGKTNIIATLGISLPQEKANEIKQKVWCFDNDVAGFQAGKKNLMKDDKIFLFPKKYKNIKDINTFLSEQILSKEEVSKMIDENMYTYLSGLVELNLRMITY